MMGGAWMTLRGDMWSGGALTALAASLEIGANHPQIAYYFLVAMGAFWISEGIGALRAQRLRDFLRRTAVLAAAGLLAAASNFAPLWYTAQHTKETTRGGSELAATQGAATGGLDLDLRHGVELRPRRDAQPADPRLHGPRLGHGLRRRRPRGRRARRLRPAGRRAAAPRLLGHAAQHGRPHLPRRRGALPSPHWASCSSAAATNGGSWPSRSSWCCSLGAATSWISPNLPSASCPATPSSAPSRWRSSSSSGACRCSARWRWRGCGATRCRASACCAPRHGPRESRAACASSASRRAARCSTSVATRAPR